MIDREKFPYGCNITCSASDKNYTYGVALIYIIFPKWALQSARSAAAERSVVNQNGGARQDGTLQPAG
jgi:hypothetical protein